jgi:hypothetical protein
MVVHLCTVKCSALGEEMLSAVLFPCRHLMITIYCSRSVMF